MLTAAKRLLTIGHGPLDRSVLVVLDNDPQQLTDDNVASVMQLMSSFGASIAFIRFPAVLLITSS